MKFCGGLSFFPSIGNFLKFTTVLCKLICLFALFFPHCHSTRGPARPTTTNNPVPPWPSVSLFPFRLCDAWS